MNLKKKNNLPVTALLYPSVSIALSLLMTGTPFSIIATATGQPTNYEGFGAVTRGAEHSPGGYETYHVTKLDDDGSSGTLRDAVSQGSRLIVFDVGGTITLTEDINIDESYITIAGETAPSPGITIIQPYIPDVIDVGTSIMPYGKDAHDIIIRYLRNIGPGDHGSSKDIWGLDGMDGHVYNIIIDHVTGIAAHDGLFDIYGEVSDVTISWNLIMDTVLPISVSYYPQNRERISFHHNVFARNNERQIRMRHHNDLIDFVNNVIYGWGWMGGGAAGLHIAPNIGVPNDDYPTLNVENNVYHFVNGLAGSEDSAIIRENPTGKVYFNGNILPAGESDNYDTSARHVIPAYAEVTKYDASTLGYAVVPYVGTHYRTQEEQDLLSEVSTAIGSVQGYVLSFSSTIGGSVINPGEGVFPYEEGTVVAIEATVDENYYFVNWTGTAVDAGKVANPNAASTTVTVDATYTIQANFDTDLHTLTISSTSGGSVTNPGEGNFLHDDGAVVSIQATADENYHFLNWTGDTGTVDDPNVASTTVTVNGDYTLQANFAMDQHTLTISSTSNGSVTNPGEGDFSYDDGSVVLIQATAATNYHFVNWTGTAVDAGKVANPNAASTTVTMDADYTLQANFAIDQRTLTFSSTAGGSVTVPGEGDFQYSHGTFVAIRVTAESDYRFVNWTGTAVDAGKVVNPNAAETSITADGDYTIVAHFGQQDGEAPVVTGLSPAVDDIQVPLNNLVILHVTDAGIGVDASSVTITLDGDIIYDGDTEYHDSLTGHCCRIGTPADFTYVYQPSQNFEFDQAKTVTVNASDLGGLAMTEQSYSFTTEMRSFGQNKQVDPTIEGLDKARPATARDSSGNIWVVWHAGPVGSRDIYIAKLVAGADAFGVSLPLISHNADQANPVIAVGANDRLYVVWQDSRPADDNALGEWDIYLSISADGATWSVETRVNDPNDGNQTNPAIVVDGQSPNYAHVVWQDDRAGHQDICIASSNDGFATKTVTQITSDPSDQTGPAVAVDASNIVYVLWTDTRNPANGLDIYGAASNAGPWTNVPIVSKGSDQSSPAIAVELSDSILHMLWVDQTSGDSGIYYANSNGLPGSPVAGSNLIDEYAKGKGQFSPAIAVTGSTGNGLRVFTCWHDERGVTGITGDTDIWFVRANSSSGTNVFVGDGGTNSDQIEPAIGIDRYGHPYVVWTDGRGANTEIYYVGSTYMRPTALTTERVTPTSLDVTVGTDPGAITDVDDFSVQLLAGTCPYDVNITITEIENPPEYALQNFLNGCDFGPSGIVFDIPVTITIPYAVTGATGTPTAYWYNSRTGALSREGITNIEIIELSSSLHALRFDSTHLTPFFAMLRSAAGSGGGGGGGCSLSHSEDGTIIEYFLPYGVLALVMVVLKWKDRKGKRNSEKLSSS